MKSSGYFRKNSMVAFSKGMKPKARAIGVSFPPDLHARIVERADRFYGGNVSAYVQRIATADLENRLPSLQHDPDVIGNLARTYSGYMAPRLTNNLVRFCEVHDTDQPALLHRLLQILAEAIEDQHPVAPQKMSIVDGDLHDKLISMHTADKYPAQPDTPIQRAAEPSQAPYTATPPPAKKKAS